MKSTVYLLQNVFLKVNELTCRCIRVLWNVGVHSVQRKSSGLIFRTSRSGSDVTYNCQHNSSRFRRAVHKETELFLNLLLYLQLNQTCHLQSTPLRSWYTAPNVLSISGTRLGTCFAGRHEGPVSNFLISPLPSEIGDLLMRISTSGTRKSPQGPNLESRAAEGQQPSHASSKIHG